MHHNHAVTRRKRKAGSPTTANAFQLKIALRYITPPIWRRVVVPDDFTLGKLHGLIQRVMGWGGGHLHEFRLPARGFGPPLRTFGHEGEDEDTTLLRDILVRKGQMLLYEYDFGDGWLHGVQLEKLLPLERRAVIPCAWRAPAPAHRTTAAALPVITNSCRRCETPPPKPMRNCSNGAVSGTPSRSTWSPSTG